MRGVYTATYKIPSLGAARTLMYLLVPAGINATLLYASVTNASNGTNQQLETEISRITAVGTPTSTAVAATKSESGDKTPACTVFANVTASEPTYDTPNIRDEGFPSLVGFFYQPPRDERPRITGGAGLGVGIRLMVAPSPSTDMLVNVSWVEEG